MNVQHVSPILNVRDLVESFAWFEKLGWSRDWDFGDPPDFGSVRNGDCDIFLCKDGQGSRENWIYVRVGSPAEIDAIHAGAAVRYRRGRTTDGYAVERARGARPPSRRAYATYWRANRAGLTSGRLAIL